MEKTLITLAVLYATTTVFAQQTSKFTDSRDGKTYKTVKIGTQTWMAENLDYDDGKYSICDPVNPGDPRKCKWGRWYDWATAMNIDTSFNFAAWEGKDLKHQGICPTGWHLPNLAEWETLIKKMGGDKMAGTKIKMKGAWNADGIAKSKALLLLTKDNLTRGELIDLEDAIKQAEFWDGTDAFNFSALPGGRIEINKNMEITLIGEAAQWWASTQYASQSYSIMIYNNSEIASVGLTDRKICMLTIRCIKN
jgi:uncharacterized protein (TIGR02145 family)